MSDEEYEAINRRVNRMIGQLTVPMMTLRDPDVKEVHGLLLELSNWLDDQVNTNNDVTEI